MRTLKPGLRLALLVSSAVLGVVQTTAAAPALQTNLLKNPSFESGLADWAPYWVPGGDGCGNQQPTAGTITSGVDPRRVKAGSTAVQISIAGGKSYQAGLQQTITGLTPGSRLRFTMWGHVWSTSTGADPTKSDAGLSANMKIGIGQGQTYAADPGITWSSLGQYFDNYQQMTVEATVTGTSATVFLMSNPSACNNWNDTYWDDGSLTVISAAGATTAPTGAATASGGTVVAPTAPAGGGLAPTSFPTPTPGEDGNIVYIVQEGDTMWRIAAVAGMTVEQLKALNGLTSDIVVVGQRLTLGTGTGGAPQPTAEATAEGEATAAETGAASPSPTGEAEATLATQEPVATLAGTPVASATTGEVCVMLYDDSNGDGTRGSGEGLLPGGLFTLIDSGSGGSAGEYTTDGTNEPHCFQELASGNYSVEVTIPDGFNATTATTFALPLTPGGTANLEFGAQSAADGGAAEGDSSSRLRTALFGAAGIIFLLMAAGVAGFLVLTQRGRRA
jgi:LysM repeat protein